MAGNGCQWPLVGAAVVDSARQAIKLLNGPFILVLTLNFVVPIAEDSEPINLQCK